MWTGYKGIAGRFDPRMDELQRDSGGASAHVWTGYKGIAGRFGPRVDGLRRDSGALRPMCGRVAKRLAGQNMIKKRKRFSAGAMKGGRRRARPRRCKRGPGGVFGRFALEKEAIRHGFRGQAIFCGTRGRFCFIVYSRPHGQARRRQGFCLLPAGTYV